MGGRVGAVGATGEHGDGGGTRGEGAAVGGGVDAEGRPRHHRHPRIAAAGADLAGHGLAVGGGGARPHDGDRASEPGEREPAAYPQPDRHATALVEAGCGVQVVEGRRPLVVAGHHEPQPRPGGPLELGGRVDVGEPDGDVGRQPVGALLRQQVADQLGAQLGDQPGEPKVARLAEPVERDPGQPLVVGDGHHPTARRS